MNVIMGESKGATKYILQKSNDGNTYELIEELPNYGTYSFESQEIGKTYYFAVKVCNSYDNCSGWVKTSLRQTTKTPTGITKTIEPLGVILNWNAVTNADGYEVVRSTTKNGKYKLVKTVTSPSLTNRGLKENTTYYYKIRSFAIVDGVKVYSSYSSRITAKTSKMSSKQKNALNKAKSYLKVMAFSYNGLVEQLEYTGYSTSVSKFAANNCGANWKSQAVKKAKEYIKYLSFSYEGLIEQLEFEGFTHEEAVYGADNCGANFESQAVISARSYLETMPFSYTGLIEQLEFEGFTHLEAVAAVDSLSVDWYAQAVRMARSYLETMSFSYEELVEQLEFEGFTHSEAVYAANAVGLS